MSLERATTIELLREHQPLACGSDIHTDLHGERHGRAERMELWVRAAEARIDLVPVALRRSIEVLYVKQRQIGERELSPAVQPVLAVHDQIGVAPSVRDGESDRDA